MTPILFDTSIWIKLIRENVSYNQWESRGVIPFLPLEVFLELFSVDENSRKKRINYLSQIPQIALLSFGEKNALCGLSELISLEYLHNILKLTIPLDDFLRQSIKIVPGTCLSFINVSKLDAFVDRQQRINTILANPTLSCPELWKLKLRDVPVEKIFEKSQIDCIDQVLSSRQYTKSRENDKSYCQEKFISSIEDLANQGLFDYLIKLATNECQDMLLSDFSRLVAVKQILPTIAENLDLTIEQLQNIDFRKLTILSILDGFHEEYCKEFWKDIRRRIESSSYVDKNLVAYSFVLPVMVDVRTKNFVNRLIKRGFSLNCFDAPNIDSFLKVLELYGKTKF